MSRNRDTSGQQKSRAKLPRKLRGCCAGCGGLFVILCLAGVIRYSIATSTPDLSVPPKPNIANNAFDYYRTAGQQIANVRQVEGACFIGNKVTHQQCKAIIAS